MNFAVPIDYPMEPGSVWHLEELLCASPETLKAGLQLLLEHRIGEYECPEDTMIFASSNRLQDYADVEMLPAPIMDRIMVITLEVDQLFL
jgi:MoxR-like ATPase